MSYTFLKQLQNRKHSSAHGSLKFRAVSSSFWEGTRREHGIKCYSSTGASSSNFSS